jgi:hypothetical protein
MVENDDSQHFRNCELPELDTALRLHLDGHSLFIYARNAFAKYISGNVAQFVGRQALGRAGG